MYHISPAVDCTVCENPLLEGKPLQRLPLIMSDWKAHTPCQQNVEHSVQQSVIGVAEGWAALEVKNDWRHELDLKISPRDKVQWALAGSHSEAIQRCIQKNSVDKYMFLLHHITCSHYKFRIGKDRFLSKHFENQVKNLPEKYDSSSKPDYFDLIRSYGTHFVTEMDMGVRARFLSAVPVCLAVLEGTTASDISRCLAIDLGLALSFDGVKNSPDFLMCKEKKKNPNFYNALQLMTEEIWGDFYFYNSIEWIKNTKSWPALLSYSLEPLHTLVDKADPRREGLRQAVSQYVRERALWRNCTKPCPPGSQPSASDFCSCECPNNNFTTSMCCAPKRGLAKLTVTIERAEDLWGDLITRSDGYVSVSFQKRRMCTHTVWNNNNPSWNVILDFGVVQLNKDFNKLEVEVWDQDFGWNDNLLGHCSQALKSWKYESATCYLDLGCAQLVKGLPLLRLQGIWNRQPSDDISGHNSSSTL
ncbi:perforin-1-like [Tiliqua scincoides]|uniref:perforin-1-like n=1 Tax=Tiliqua scincoides TaxID=71010 RepID=UPI003462FF2C